MSETIQNIMQRYEAELALKQAYIKQQQTKWESEDGRN